MGFVAWLKGHRFCTHNLNTTQAIKLCTDPMVIENVRLCFNVLKTVTDPDASDILYCVRLRRAEGLGE